MGCHTWFYRPLSIDNITVLKQYALKSLNDIWEEDQLIVDKDYIEKYCLTKKEYDFLRNRIELNDIYVIVEYAKLSINDSIYVIEEKLYLELSYTYFDKTLPTLYPIQKYFHDNFRIDNYPNWIIHNKRQLRRKLGKKWYKLTEEQISEINDFWKIYPGGVIDFG